MAGDMTGAGDETNLTLLASEGLEFLISGGGKVPLSSIEQMTTTCLYFSANWCRPCRNLNPRLVELYNTINSMGKKLEIIFISSDRDEKSFTEHYKHMPWLAAPFNARLQRRLSNRYGVDGIPSLIPITLDGKTVGEDAVQLVGDYGVDAFPFTAQRREELKAMDDAKSHGGSLLHLLGSSKRDYVISKDGLMVPIADLVGKTIGLYFGAHWCPPCRAFTILLQDAYKELRSASAKNECLEIIFVSTDRDTKEFNMCLSNMPWLAIPYSDKTRHELSRIFDVKGIPTLVLLGPDGKPLGTDGRAMISSYGAKAFPFTDSRAAEVEAALKKEGEGLLRQVTDLKHDHELKLDMTKTCYVCDFCGERGRFWVFSCDKCDYDLHPSCVEQTYS